MKKMASVVIFAVFLMSITIAHAAQRPSATPPSSMSGFALYDELAKIYAKDCARAPAECIKLTDSDFWKIVSRSPVVAYDTAFFLKSKSQSELVGAFNKFRSAARKGATSADLLAAKQEFSRLIPIDSPATYARWIYLADKSYAKVLGINYVDFFKLELTKQLAKGWYKKFTEDNAQGGQGGGDNKDNNTTTAGFSMPSTGAGVVSLAACMNKGSKATVKPVPGLGGGPGGPQAMPGQGPDGGPPAGGYGPDDKPSMQGSDGGNTGGDFDEFCAQVAKLPGGNLGAPNPLDDFDAGAALNGGKGTLIIVSYYYTPKTTPDGVKYIQASSQGYSVHEDGSVAVLSCTPQCFFDSTLSVSKDEAQVMIEALITTVSDSVVNVYGKNGDSTYSNTSTSGTAESPSPTGSELVNNACGVSQSIGVLGCLGLLGGKDEPDCGKFKSAGPAATPMGPDSAMGSGCGGHGAGGLKTLPGEWITDPPPNKLQNLKGSISNYGATSPQAQKAATEAFGKDF